MTETASRSDLLLELIGLAFTDERFVEKLSALTGLPPEDVRRLCIEEGLIPKEAP